MPKRRRRRNSLINGRDSTLFCSKCVDFRICLSVLLVAFLVDELFIIFYRDLTTTLSDRLRLHMNGISYQARLVRTVKLFRSILLPGFCATLWLYSASGTSSEALKGKHRSLGNSYAKKLHLHLLSNAIFACG